MYKLLPYICQFILCISSILMFIAITLLADDERQLWGVKLPVLASVNSSLTYLLFESEEVGLYDFPYITISCLWSARLFLLLRYSFKQVRTLSSRFSQTRYSNLSSLDVFLECFSNWVVTKTPWNVVNHYLNNMETQSAFTCSKLAIETLASSWRLYYQ